MANGNLSPLFPVFFGVWSVLALCSAGFFRLNKNANLKRADGASDSLIQHATGKSSACVWR